MSGRHRWAVGAALLLLAQIASAAVLAVLTPVTDGNTALMRRAPSGKVDAPVVRRVRDGKLFRALQQEAAHGFTAGMLALDGAAMQVAHAGSVTWLLLSQRDGGFARRGFWLQEAGATRWIDEPMVDLVVDAESVADGSFEEIFAHELGHVMLRRLLPELPSGYSRTPHHSYALTDQQTAFDEGFATHFQAVSRNRTRNPRLKLQDQGLDGKLFTRLWQSNLDRTLRIDGVRRNDFVYQQLPLPEPGEALARREQSTLFDVSHLKNPAQMLASEGVLATVFYRYLAPDDTPRASLTSRYLALFQALHALHGQKLTPATPLLPLLAQTMLRLAPAEGRRLVRVMLETSDGALASAHLAGVAEALALPGRNGDADAFVPALAAARKEMAEQILQVQAHPERLADAAGVAIWLLLPANATAHADARSMDLNTAEREELLALPGMQAAAADRALASRRRDGLFRDLADFVQRAKLGRDAAAALDLLARAAQEAGPYLRQ